MNPIRFEGPLNPGRAEEPEEADELLEPSVSLDAPGRDLEGDEGGGGGYGHPREDDDHENQDPDI